MTTAIVNGSREYLQGRRTSKVDRYGWVIRDQPGEFLLICKHELKFDHDYQRDKISTDKVAAITSSFSWVGFGCILVVRRPDGSLWVIDGQHRVLAALNRSDISDLPCMVFEVDGIEAEASGFLVANTLRKPLPAINKFKAAVISGRPSAVCVDAVLKRLGVRVSDNAYGKNEIKCVGTCEKHAAKNPATFEAALKVALELDGDEPVHRDMLDGLVWLQGKYKLLNDERFVRRFSSMSRHDILASMQRFAIAQGKNSDKIRGMAILQCVNKGLRQRFGDADD